MSAEGKEMRQSSEADENAAVGGSSSRSGTPPALACFVALCAGFAGGWAINLSGKPILERVAEYAAVPGHLWLNALQMIVLPLMVTTPMTAILVSQTVGITGKISGGVVAIFFLMHALAGAFAVVATPPVVNLFRIDPGTASALKARVSQGAESRDVPPADPAVPESWVDALIPKNLAKSAVEYQLLPLLVAATLSAFAVTRAPLRSALRIGRVIRSLSDVLYVLAGWILKFTPLGVFALTLVFTARAGVGVSGVLGRYVGIACGLLIVFTIMLYPLTALLGGVSLRRFAGAAVQPQVTAAGTMSSIATLPALLQAAEIGLRLDPVTARISLPLSVSVFRVNRSITSTIRLFLLAQVFAVPLGPARVASFIFVVIITSFTLPGVPTAASGFRTLPAFVPAGIPVEGVVLLQTVEILTDVFRTVANVTGDLAVATIAARFAAKGTAGGRES